MNYESHLKRKKHEGRNVFDSTLKIYIYFIIGN